jgi:hypothetical protein
MFNLWACVAKWTLLAPTGIITPSTHNFPTAGEADFTFLKRKWHWQEADRTILFGRRLFEQGLVVQPGGALLASFFVARPMPPLTRYAAILGVLARIAHLEVGAALATLGTTCRRSRVVHGIAIR